MILKMLWNIENIVMITIDGWLFGFYGISTFVGYLTPNPITIEHLRVIQMLALNKHMKS